MRIFTASLAAESNTFSPLPVSIQDFYDSFYAPPGKHPETPTLCSGPMVALRKRAWQDGFELVEGTAAWAEPGGVVNRQAYEHLRDEILTQLEAALPVQAVVLGLHGAMVAQGYDDCEGDLMRQGLNTASCGGTFGRGFKILLMIDYPSGTEIEEEGCIKNGTL